MSDRPSWGETFTQSAKVWEDRAACTRRKVGAVVVKDKEVIGSGYNGAPSGEPHCTDGGCPRGKMGYDEVPASADYNVFPCVAIHAEHNAILAAGKAACRGATIYVTAEPCGQCAVLIRHVGITKVVVV